MDKFELVPLFGHEEKISDCINLLNEEWPKSETFRLNSLNKYCKPSPPMSLLLLDLDTGGLIGHSRFLNVCNYGAGRAAYLESLIIRKSDRGKGLGKVLVQKCVEKAKNEGYSVVLLCTEDQMEFYEKCGFQCCEFLPILTMGVEACVANSVVFSEITPINRKECNTTLPASDGVVPYSTTISNGPLPPPPPPPSIKSPIRSYFMVAFELVVQINRMLNVVSWVLLVFAICYTSVFLFFLFRTSLIHGNLKFVMTCTLIENHLLQFCRFLNTDYLDPSSNNFFDRFACRTTNCVFSVCYLATVFSVITIGGERLIASLNIRSYERFSNSLGQGYVCTLILVGTAFGLVTTDWNLNPQQRTCVFVMEHTVFYGQLICTMMIVSLFGWGMQFIVYRWNMKMLKDKAVPLSMRYQINENIIVLRLLFPVMIFYFITTLAATVIVLKSFVSESNDSPEQKARDLFISNILKITGQCSTLTFMFSFVCRHPGFKAAFVCRKRRRICEGKRRVISHESWAHNETNVYFQELRKNWELAKGL